MSLSKSISVVAAVVIVSVAAPILVRIASQPCIDRVSTREMAERYLRAGLSEQARDGFLRAIKEDPADVRAHGGRIMHIYRCRNHFRNEIKEMKVYYIQRYENDKESALNNFCLALVQAHFGSVVDTRLFDVAMKSEPQMPLVHYWDGHILLHFDKEEYRERGVAQLRKEIEINPSFAASYEDLFEHLVSRGREREALDTALEGRRNTGDSTLLAAEMAELRLSRGEIFDAVRESIRAKLGGRWALAVLAVALAAGAAWVWAIRRQDIYESALRTMMLPAFVLGILSVPLAQAGYFVAEVYLLPPVENAVNDYWNIFAEALRAGFVEEIAKFLLLGLVVWKSRRLNEIVDGIMFCAVAAVGFAAVENAIYVRHLGVSVLAGRFFVTTAMQVFGAGIIGYFLAREKLYPSERPIMAFAGLVIAIIFHGAYEAAVNVGGVVADLAFLVVAGEMVLFQYFFTKALASSPSRAAAAKGVHSKAANEILVVLACVFAAVFGAVWAVLLAEYRSIDAIVRLSLLDMLRALFLVVFYYALVQAAWRLWRRAVPRLFIR